MWPPYNMFFDPVSLEISGLYPLRVGVPPQREPSDTRSRPIYDWTVSMQVVNII